MKFITAISTHKNQELYIKGLKLTDLIETHSFAQGIFLLLKGALPTDKEDAMLNTLLIAMMEHGVQAPSSFVSRTVASTGNPVNAALAAGVLAIGEYHGGAIEQCAKLLQSGKSAIDIVNETLRMPGYGHKVYKEYDPRTQVIFKKAKELGFHGKFVALAVDIQQALKTKTQKQLALNIDGAVAAVMSEMAIDWRFGKSLFILGRMPGLMAHVHEEMTREKPYRRLDDSEVEYDGVEIAES